MIVFIGMDDTDNSESRGTGHLARATAAWLSATYALLGVVRHQLFFDRRVPYTKNNSSAAILLQGEGEVDLGAIFQQVKEIMLADFQPGSDPGLCVATGVPEEIIAIWPAGESRPGDAGRSAPAGEPDTASCWKDWAAPKAG